MSEPSFELTDDGVTAIIAGRRERIVVSRDGGRVFLNATFGMASLDGMPPDAADHLSRLLAENAQWAREETKEYPERRGEVLLARHPPPTGNGTTVGLQAAPPPTAPDRLVPRFFDPIAGPEPL